MIRSLIAVGAFVALATCTQPDLLTRTQALVTTQSEPTLAHTVREGQFGEMAYTVALPTAYDDTQQYALMVYLHGAGMSGEAIPPDTPLIVLMPQMPSYSRWSFYADDVLGLVDEVTANYPIDERRIYMTGYSDGGYGALAIGAAGAERFAAVLSGGGYWLGDAQPLCTLAEQQVPISLHHAELDTIIPFEKALDVEKHLTGCGADVRLIAYQGETHISVVSMIFQGSGIYEWLLSQQRAG